jgi:LysM repeat protein
LELKKQIVKRVHEKGRAFSQITLDDDYIIRDNKPDVIKVIHAHGRIVFEESKVTAQAVWISGKLSFGVLYRSDDAFHKLEILTGAIPFQEKIQMEGISELDPVSLQGEIEDLSVSLINSRKLAVRAVVNIRVQAEETLEEEIAEGLVDPQGCQEKQSKRQMLLLLQAKKDIFRTRCEVRLPNAKPNIQKILWYSIDVRNVESSPENGKLHMQGEACIAVLYQSEEEEQIQWMDTVVPFSGEVEYDAQETPDLFWISLTPEDLNLELLEDYDGENRMIGADLSFQVDFKLWKEEMIQILEDVYSLDREVLPRREMGLSPCFRMKNVAKIRIGDQFRLEHDQEKILQICCYHGDIHIDRTSVTENGVAFEGVLRVHILYFTADDNFPIAHLEEILPFEQVVEIAGISENTRYEYQASVDQLQVNLLDNAEYEIKAGLRLAVLAFDENCVEKITELEELPQDMEQLVAQPGLVGYVVQEQEDLWDVAKKYHTTTKAIEETNSLKSQSLKAGTKLIIVKQLNS